jgi:hypothetical protein
MVIAVHVICRCGSFRAAFLSLGPIHRHVLVRMGPSGHNCLDYASRGVDESRQGAGQCQLESGRQVLVRE